jgi:ribosomal protein L24
MLSSTSKLLYNKNKIYTLFNFQLANYGRKFTIKKIDRTPIFPGDQVIVYPVYHGLKLSPFQKKIIENNKKFQEESQIKYGQVIKVLRRKHQIIVSGINPKEIYTPPESFFSDFERKNFANIQKQIKFLPIDIKRVKLRNPNESGLVPMEVHYKKDEDGRLQRYSLDTGEIVPVNIPYKSYAERHIDKKEGQKDTTADIAAQKTYFGEDYVGIAQEFLARLREKREVESLLFLKDK